VQSLVGLADANQSTLALGSAEELDSDRLPVSRKPQGTESAGCPVRLAGKLYFITASGGIV
jgi:hypothetical protein